MELTATHQPLAVPCGEGLDTEILLGYLESSPLQIVDRPMPHEPTLFDGQVAIRHHHALNNNLENAPADHHHIAKAVELLRICWPEAYKQFGAVIREFQPMYLPGNKADGFVGSMSHQPKGTVCSVWATVNDYICLCQALVHELAHNKLFCLGQHFDDSAPLFDNADTELFDSPIRLDVPRPMPAVFHGVYAFTHVIALNLKMLENGELNADERKYVISLLNKNVRRVRIGLDVVIKCAKSTPFGSPIIKEAIAWAQSEIRRAEPYLEKINADAPLLIIGPSGAGKTAFSRTLAEKTGKKYISLDSICWTYWYHTPFIQNLLLKLMGESKLYLWNKAIPDAQKEALIKDLVKKGVVRPEALDWLKLQLVVYAVNELKGKIVDAGSGHVVFTNAKYLTQLKKYLMQNGITVIQVRPVADIEQTVEILKDRIKDRHYTHDEIGKAKKNLLSPAYRTLCDFVIDSNDPVEACISRFFEFGELAAGCRGS